MNFITITHKLLMHHLYDLTSTKLIYLEVNTVAA